VGETHEASIGIAYDATIWRSYGNFGSTIFDPLDNEYLQVYVCDECLKKKQKLVQKYRVSNKVTASLEPFNV